MSEFADYVESQQTVRYPSTASATGTVEEHDELEILNGLDLEDKSSAVRLKELLLSNDIENLAKLAAFLQSRIDEGHGETIFELGVENNGDPMGLTKSDWDIALKRLVAGAKEVRSDCQVLYTKGVDADDVGSEGCHGKMLIRQHPASVEEVIETRIAVVGNVDAGKSTMLVCICSSKNIFHTNHS